MNSSNDSLAMRRITKLVDENSFMEIGSLVTARNTDFNLADTDTPSDGVITGHGLVDGNLVFVPGCLLCSAHTIPSTPGIWRICSRVTVSLPSPYQRKVMCIM